MKTLSLEAFRSKQFETVVFAGGGNRCWWQAGLVEGLSGSALWTPTTFVGASAGAGIAVAAVTHKLRASLAAAVERFSRIPVNVDWSSLLKGSALLSCLASTPIGFSPFSVRPIFKP